MTLLAMNSPFPTSCIALIDERNLIIRSVHKELVRFSGYFSADGVIILSRTVFEPQKVPTRGADGQVQYNYIYCPPRASEAHETKPPA